MGYLLWRLDHQDPKKQAFIYQASNAEYGVLNAILHYCVIPFARELLLSLLLYIIHRIVLHMLLQMSMRSAIQ